jgi:hypothetical protein
VWQRWEPQWDLWCGQGVESATFEQMKVGPPAFGQGRSDCLVLVMGWLNRQLLVERQSDQRLLVQGDQTASHRH